MYIAIRLVRDFVSKRVPNILVDVVATNHALAMCAHEMFLTFCYLFMQSLANSREEIKCYSNMVKLQLPYSEAVTIHPAMYIEINGRHRRDCYTYIRESTFRISLKMTKLEMES